MTQGRHVGSPKRVRLWRAKRTFFCDDGLMSVVEQFMHNGLIKSQKLDRLGEVLVSEQQHESDQAGDKGEKHNRRVPVRLSFRFFLAR